VRLADSRCDLIESNGEHKVQFLRIDEVLAAVEATNPHYAKTVLGQSSQVPVACGVVLCDPDVVLFCQPSNQRLIKFA
jgi:hypothetical protein